MEPETLALLIPILGIVFGCGIPLLSIYLSYRKRKSIYELHHKERLAAIEKGMEVPPLPEAFFKEDSEQPRTKDPRRSLLVGMIWFFIGLGLAAWWVTEERSYIGLSLIPIGIGVSYIAYYLLEGRHGSPPVDRSEATPNGTSQEPSALAVNAESESP